MNDEAFPLTAEQARLLLAWLQKRQDLAGDAPPSPWHPCDTIFPGALQVDRADNSQVNLNVTRIDVGLGLSLSLTSAGRVLIGAELADVGVGDFGSAGPWEEFPNLFTDQESGLEFSPTALGARLFLLPASATQQGALTTGVQHVAGSKIFEDGLFVFQGGSGPAMPSWWLTPQGANECWLLADFPAPEPSGLAQQVTLVLQPASPGSLSTSRAVCYLDAFDVDGGTYQPTAYGVLRDDGTALVGASADFLDAAGNEWFFQGGLFDHCIVGGGGGGGSLAIGSTVTGAAFGAVLYVDATGLLAQDSALSYDAATHTLTVSELTIAGLAYTWPAALPAAGSFGALESDHAGNLDWSTAGLLPPDEGTWGDWGSSEEFPCYDGGTWA